VEWGSVLGGAASIDSLSSFLLIFKKSEIHLLQYEFKTKKEEKISFAGGLFFIV